MSPVPRPLRDAQSDLDHLTAYVRKIADSLGLRDHTFEVHVAPLPDDVRATCHCISGRRYNILTVAPDFFTLDPEEQREAVVHETLHPHFHPLSDHVLEIRPDLGRSHHEMLMRTFQRDIERSVDALTTALTKLMPLP